MATVLKHDGDVLKMKYS